MKIHSLLIALSFTISNAVIAQVPYTMTNYAGAGTTLNFSYSNDLIGLNAGSSGASQNWNFSTLTVNRQELLTVEDAAGSNYQLSYTGLCILAGGNPLTCLTEWNAETDFSIPSTLNINTPTISLSNSKEFYKKGGNYLINTVAGVTFNSIPAPVKYTIPDTLFHFPLQFGNTHQAKSLVVFDMNPIGQNIIYKIGKSRSYVIDAWGTLQTPYMTLDSITRVKVTIQRRDTIINNGTTIPLLPVTQVEYLWFQPRFKLPVLELHGVSTFGLEVFNSIRYIDEPRCLPPNALGLAYPFTAAIGEDVAFNSFVTNAAQVHWTFGDGQSSNANNPSHSYAQAGTYTVTLTGCNTNCNPTQCDTFTTTVTVADPTAVEEKNEALVLLYPNPSHSHFMLQMQEPVAYVVYDLMGTEIVRGTTQGGTTGVDCSSWSDGLYLVTLQTAQKTHFQTIVVQH